MIIVACPVRDAGNEQVHKGPTFNNVHMQSATNLVDQDGGLSKQTFIKSGFLWSNGGFYRVGSPFAR